MVLEGSEVAVSQLRSQPDRDAFVGWVEDMRPAWVGTLGDDPAIVLAERRYDYIHRLVAAAVHRTGADELTWSDRVDRLLAHPWAGLPILGIVLYLTLQITFGLAGPMVDWLDGQTGKLSANATAAPDWLVSLFIDGALAGVSTVLTFLPNVAFLFLAISILEDSGYLARAAFVLARVMAGVGLPGRAVVPMVLGFGCTVSAVVGARILESRRERLTTILVTPFMSCSARFPVYVLLAGAFFANHVGLIVFILYALGTAVALGSALLVRHTLLPGPPTPFILEFPGYKLPSLRTTGLAVWQRTWAFFRRAGINIVIGSLVIWLLGSMPWGVEFNSTASWLGTLAKGIEPLISPLGLGQREGLALLIGLAAKELVLGGLAVLYAGASDVGMYDEGGLQAAMATAISPAAAAGLLVFVLLYVPCFAAVAAIRAETGSWRWTALQVTYSIAVAWLGAFVVFQVGQALGYA